MSPVSAATHVAFVKDVAVRDAASAVMHDADADLKKEHEVRSAFSSVNYGVQDEVGVTCTCNMRAISLAYCRSNAGRA